MKTLFSLLAGWLLLYTGALLAQPITVTTVTDTLTQCGPPSSFTVMINNSTANALPINSIRIQLPSCVRYDFASLSGLGFTEDWINTNGDSLNINYAPSLPAFGTATFTINVQAVCGVNCGSSVTNNVHVIHGLGTANSLPDPYNIQSPSLSMTVSPQVTNTTLGSTFQRCMTLTNGGFGALSSLRLSVQSNTASLNDYNFRLGTNGALLTPSGSPTQILTIGPGQIQTVGDLDTLLEQGESIMICYNVTVVDCINSLSSSITASWGCNGQTCASTSVSTDVIVPTVLPHIVASKTYTENQCYGGNTPSLIEIILKNDGNGPARDVIVHVWEGDQGLSTYDHLSAFNSGNVEVRHSLGGSTLLSPYAMVGEAGAPCFMPNAKQEFKVKIPFIPAHSEDTIRIERYTCCKTSCIGEYIRRIFFKVEYSNQCRTNIYPISPIRIASDNIGRVVSMIHTGASNLDTAWANYEIEHSDFIFFNRLGGSFAIVEFEVPAGLQFDIAKDSIYFDYPTRPLHWLPDTIIQNGPIIRAKFNFSQTGYSGLLEKVMLKFRMRADCAAGPCAGGPKTLQYKIYEKADPNCVCEALIACHELTVNTHCGFCPTTCTDGGMMFTGFDARRKNYGPSDNNEDGLPDAVNSLNFAEIRTRHLILRDILTTKFSGIVETTTANSQWETGFAKSSITQGALLSPLSYKLRIVDQSTGFSHLATSTVIDTLTYTGGRSFTCSLNPVPLSFTPPLPSNFVYSQGDSVEVTVEYVVDSNMGAAIEPQSIINEFKLQGTNGLIAGCDSYRGDFVLVGYYYKSGASEVYKADGCDTVEVSENYYLSIGNCCNNYHGGNVFRKEFRHFAIPSQHIVTVPNGYTVVGATMEHWRTKGLFDIVYYQQVGVPFATSGNVSTLDLATRFQPNGGIPAGDEGFSGVVKLKLVPSCRVTPLQTQFINHRMTFAPIPAFTGPGSDSPSDEDDDRITYEPPNLVITPTPTTALGVSSTVNWNFTLSNNSNVADAVNVWFALVSPSGQVIPTTFQTNCSTAFTPTQGGIYQVGALAHGASRTYCITATYASCGLDSLRIIAGWDCNTYPANAPAYTCTPTVRTLYVQPQPAEMQATITTSRDTVGICDSLWVEATVVSTQIGHLNNISLAFGLPLTAGLTYVPGSATLLYPTNGIPQPVADPLSGPLTWDIDSINATIATIGLPGVLPPAHNTFKLRFLVRTNCSMVSGDRIRLQVNAFRSCGQALTPLILLSPPINITGANPPYQSNVATTITDVSDCPMTKRITVTMVNAGAGLTATGDRIVLNFGNGYTYSGGFLGISNPPSPSAPTVQSGTGGSSMTWTITGGLAQGATVSFSFLVTVGNDATCGTDIAAAQALHNQVLYCARTASNCATSAVQTGSSSLNITNNRPALGFTAFNATLQHITGADRFHYDLSMQNLGLTVASGITIPIDFYCDRDGSCSFTPGDNLLFTVNHTMGIGSNATIALSGNVNAPINSCPANTQILAMVNPSFCNCGTANICTMLILPVEWQSLHGEALADANEVTWTATILPGHDHFILEKATGQGWSDISGPIYGSQGSYAARDAQPAQVERYRVRAVDQDGSTKHSPEVEVVRKGSDYVAQIFPNPATKMVNLQAPSGSQFRIFNALGQQVSGGTIGSNAPQPLDISRYAGGIYQVEFRLGNHQVRLRLVVE